MIILYLPFNSNKKSMEGCSIYNRMRRIFRWIVDNDPNAHIIYAGLNGLDYKDGLDHPRILAPKHELGIKVQDYDLRTQAKLATHFHSSFLPSLCLDNDNSLYYDVIWNDLARSSNYIASLLACPVLQEDLPMVNFWEFPTMPDDNYFSIMNRVYVRTMYHGLTYGHNVFETPDHERRLFSRAKEYLSDNEIARVRGRTAGYMGSIDVSDVNKGRTFVPTTSPIRIHISSRISASSHVREICEVADKLYSLGKDIELVITTQGDNGVYGNKVIGYLKDKGVKHQIHWRCGQKEFYDIAATCAIGVENHGHADFAAGFFERVSLGQIGVYLNKPWIENILNIPNYKFKYSNDNELFLVLKYIVENINSPEVAGEAKRLRDKVVTSFDTPIIAEQLYSKSKEIVKATCDRLSIDGNYPSVSEITDNAVKTLPDNFSFKQFREACKRTSHTGVDPLKYHFAGKNSKFDYIRHLKYLGFNVGYTDTWQLKFSK